MNSERINAKIVKTATNRPRTQSENSRKETESTKRKRNDVTKIEPKKDTAKKPKALKGVTGK